MCETASYELLCVKISLVVFPVEDGKNKGKGRKGKERHKKSHRRYISPIHEEVPGEQIFTKFCMSEDMLDVIEVKKLRGLGFTEGSNFGFSH